MKGAGRRVAITGYGVVAPCGIGRKAFWDGLNGPGITDHRAMTMKGRTTSKPSTNATAIARSRLYSDSI